MIYKTRHGAEVRILTYLGDTKLVGGRTTVGIYKLPNNKEWNLQSWYGTGRFYPDINGKPRFDELDLILDEEKVKKLIKGTENE